MDEPKAYVQMSDLDFLGSMRIGLIFLQKKEVTSARATDQKSVDKPLLTTIKKVPHLFEYLQSNFSLRNGDRPHEMKW